MSRSVLTLSFVFVAALMAAGCGHVDVTSRDAAGPVAVPVTSEPPRSGPHPEVVQAGDPVLRNAAAEVDPAAVNTPEVQALIQRMIRVMRESPGVGLAAPQIGVPLRIFVLEDRQEYLDASSPLEVAERERVPVPVHVFINPVVEPVGDRTAAFFEGCLSVAGYAGIVERAHAVRVSGLDQHGEARSWEVSGWPARILQHEFDHLNGTLYVDRMMTRSFMTGAAAKQRFTGRPIAEVLSELGLP